MQVVNSVVMNHVTIGESCSIQGSVICSNVQLQERAVLKDCQVICFTSRNFSWLQFELECDIACLGRLEQVLWSLLVVSARGRSWLRNESGMWKWRLGKYIAKWLLFCLIIAWSKFCAFCCQQLQFGDVSRRSNEEILILPIYMHALCSFLQFVWKWLQSVLNIHLCKWLPIASLSSQFSAICYKGLSVGILLLC